MHSNGSNGGAALLAPAVTRSGPNPHAHSVRFYDDDGFLLDELGSFIGLALEAGHPGIVFATAAHREGLTARLTARGLDMAGAIDQGRYVALDAAETLAACTRGGWPDAARFSDHVGGVVAGAIGRGARPGAAIYGELVALLCADGRYEAAVSIEQYWNDLARTHAFHLHCAYPMAAFGRTDDGAAIEQICAVHSDVLPTEGFTALVDDDERTRAITRLQQQARALETEIAERQRVERVLRERNRELSAAVAARDEFLSVAAHELKTPVTSLRAYAQLLLRDARRTGAIAPERLASALEAIERQTGKLNRLVARLLDTAQIEAGRLRLEPAPTDLAALTRAVLAEHRGRGDYTLVFAGPDCLEAEVDLVRFEQVIANLLDNAVKFSPAGGVVTIDLREDGGGGVRLSVTDQGVGVPPEQRESVFDRFHQGHGARHLAGMGLGLHISREIVGLHGGSVRVEEAAAGGARFVVTLPATVAAPQTAPAA